MASPRKTDPSGKKVSKLYVEPAELARKLIKELEGTKYSEGGQVWVGDEYTVFLCREDFGRFRSHLDQLVQKLEGHVEKHIQSRRYATQGAVCIELTMDPDLKPGYFGVLAERADFEDEAPRGAAPSRPSGGRSVWDVPEDADYDEGYNDYAPAPARGAGVPLPTPPAPGIPPALGPSYGRPFPAPPGAGQSQYGAPSPPPSLAGQQPPQMGYPAPPQMPPQPRMAAPAMPPAVPSAMPPSMPSMAGAAGAAAAGAMAGAAAGAVGQAFSRAPQAQPAAPTAPAGEPLVLKVNGQERVFPQGKAVVGRSRDVDLQIDNVDVSRRHAMIYWSEGSIVVKDLGSTNGTMVNGYPIDSTVVRPSDVIRIGNCHITAAPR